MPSEKLSLTEEQKTAIEFKGKNMLVSAAAGSGKTFVLVERVIRRILSKEEPCDIERLLVVTFTEKAALEMKERIRAALQKAREENPHDHRITRQLSLLERAQISTIHSFCLSIVKRYFYRVDLDPGFRVLDSNEAELLRYEAVDEVFEDRYRAGPDKYEFFPALVEGYGGRGVDEGLKEIVLKFHEFLQTQPYADEWLDNAFALYEQVEVLFGPSAQRQSQPEAEAEPATADPVQNEFDEMVLKLPWATLLLESLGSELEEAVSCAQQACAICRMPGGPEHYLPVIEQELCFFEHAHRVVQTLWNVSSGLSMAGNSPCSNLARVGGLEELRGLANFEFQKLPSKRKSGADPGLSKMAKDLRDRAKKAFRKCISNVIMRPAAHTLKEIVDLLPVMKSFAGIVVDLDHVYKRKKKAQSGVDFSDLERYSLDILRQEDGLLAAEIRAGYDYIFVDEYQDTNPVQEEILSLVSAQDNLFMVGDIKQSIYRFRLADPGIFIEKYMAYTPAGEGQADGLGSPGARAGLSRNFRSRKQVIDAVNYLFERIMKQDVAEIDYTEDHKLYLGAAYPDESEYNLAAELILVERENRKDIESLVSQEAAHASGKQGTGSGQDELLDPGGSGGSGRDSDMELYEALEKEALVVAWKIKQLLRPENGFNVWDAGRSQFRKCMFRDIAVLMRSTKGRANAVIDILQRCGIPAYCELGTGYFRAREVEVALSLLSVIDNPRQDIPLAAVLRSPVTGLAPKDLAIIKATCPKGKFYDSVKAFAAAQFDASNESGEVLEPEVDRQEIQGLQKTLAEFLENLARWRTMSRRMPLAHVLWAVLRETGYYDYAGGLPGGSQRQANLRALVNRAMEFDKFGRHGLFRFLRFIERIQESKGDLGSARALGEQEDVVQVLSVHKSKGLEFPVVFVIDLGKEFNMQDLRSDILFHKDLGIGAMYCDLSNRVKYPTLAFKANQIQIRKDNLAEEMRILYVAMTRAREKLYLVGSARELAKQAGKWQNMGLDRAATYLDWICPSILPKFRQIAGPDQCETGHRLDSNVQVPFDVQFFGLPGTPQVPEPFSRGGVESSVTWNEIKNLMPLRHPGNPEVYAEVKRRLEWGYAYKPFTHTPAKMSAGELKSRLDLEDEFLKFLPGPDKRLAFSQSKTGYGVERGIAIHALLARMDLSGADCEERVSLEIDRLSGLGFLDKQYVSSEDIPAIAGFFRSQTGKILVSSPHRVKREVPFTMRASVGHMIGAGAAGEEQDGTGFQEGQAAFDLLSGLSERGAGPRGETACGATGQCSNEGSYEVGGLRDSVLVQGVIDVIVETGDGLLILDYKTDSLTLQQLPQAVKRYTPQVALYACAAEKILQVPVKHTSIVFLTLGKEIEVDWRSYLSGIDMAGIFPLSRGL